MPRRNVWVTEEVDKLIKELDINLSGFINEEIPLRFNPIRHIRNEIKNHKGKIKELKDKLKQVEKKQGNSSRTNQEMINTLVEMNKKLKEDPYYFPGMLKRFRNEFSHNLSQSEFKKLLRKYGDDENLNRNDGV